MAQNKLSILDRLKAFGAEMRLGLMYISAVAKEHRQEQKELIELMLVKGIANFTDGFFESSEKIKLAREKGLSRKIFIDDGALNHPNYEEIINGIRERTVSLRQKFNDQGLDLQYSVDRDSCSANRRDCLVTISKNKFDPHELNFENLTFREAAAKALKMPMAELSHVSYGFIERHEAVLRTVWWPFGEDKAKMEQRKAAERRANSWSEYDYY